jgi:transposase InsO family protein
MMARLLKVSRSGYYAWRKRPASKRDVANAALTEVIKAIHEDSRRTYGARRVHAELQDEFELRVARHRVARLMRLEGLQGVHRRKGRRRRGHLHELHQDHVSGQFTRDAPDRVWVADVTQHRSDEGWVYLSVVIDVFHRHVVGWAMDDVLNTDLVLKAFQMAQQVRRPEPGLIHHSDQGSPYGSLRFGRHLRASGVVGSMGRSGTPADNAVAESFFATLQTELLDRHDWPTRDALRMAIFEFIEVFYNRQRRHSHLGNLSPVEFERRWHEQQQQAQVTSP